MSRNPPIAVRMPSASTEELLHSPVTSSSVAVRSSRAVGARVERGDDGGLVGTRAVGPPARVGDRQLRVPDGGQRVGLPARRPVASAGTNVATASAASSSTCTWSSSAVSVTAAVRAVVAQELGGQRGGPDRRRRLLQRGGERPRLVDGRRGRAHGAAGHDRERGEPEERANDLHGRIVARRPPLRAPNRDAGTRNWCERGPMRVVVVGASGNVGTALLRRFVGDGTVTSVVGVARRVPRGTPPAPVRRRDVGRRATSPTRMRSTP